MGLDAMALVGNVSHRKFNKVKDAFDPRWLDKEELEMEDREMMIWRYRSTNAPMFSIVWMNCFTCFWINKFQHTPTFINTSCF